MTFDDIHTHNAALAKILRQAREAARGTENLLLLGEAGTGKFTLCHAIHAASPRSSAPFVVVDAACDAHRAEEAVRAAAGGTLVVREPILLPVDALEVIGKSKDPRILVTSTRKIVEVDMNRDVYDALRPDLRAEPVFFPPLRSHLEDLPGYLDRFARATFFRRDYAGYAQDLLDALSRRPWPGNLTEFRKTVDDLVLLAAGPLLTAADLGRTTLDSPQAKPVEDVIPLEEVKRAAILRAVARFEGNQSAASKALQINRNTLLKYIKPPAQ